MVAYDSRRWPDPEKRLKHETLDALASALAEQRAAGQTPLPSVKAAIGAAAREARERAIPPETLLVQLKIIADQAGTTPSIGDEAANAMREWIVNACIAAYYETKN